MTAFSYLEEDGIVQKTGYGNALSVIVNTPYQYEKTEIPVYSALIIEADQSIVQTPKLEEAHK